MLREGRVKSDSLHMPCRNRVYPCCCDSTRATPCGGDFSRISPLFPHRAVVCWSALILDFPCPANTCNRAIPTCHYFTTSHFTASQRAFTCSPRARLVLGDLTLTEQLPTSPSPLKSRPQHPPTIASSSSAIPASDEFVCTSPRKHHF